MMFTRKTQARFGSAYAHAQMRALAGHAADDRLGLRHLDPHLSRRANVCAVSLEKGRILDEMGRLFFRLHCTSFELVTRFGYTSFRKIVRPCRSAYVAPRPPRCALRGSLRWRLERAGRLTQGGSIRFASDRINCLSLLRAEFY